MKQFIISIKGVIKREEHYLLLKNEREEWELPGGRLEDQESPEACVIREVKEETGLQISITSILDTWIYEVLPGKEVFIVTYLCQLDSHTSKRLIISEEHQEIGWFSLQELDTLSMPEGYKKSIKSANSLV